MKKTLLLAILGLAGLTANAQLPSGSVAPDFTATDINGNTHTLSEYLTQGKTVILDISATWCGPCWQFHQAHVLENLHMTYGPAGSDEIVVIFVEGDPQTTNDNLNGISGPIPTQGNWVAGTNYPIIDSSTIADLYNTEYFPTLYRICPNGILTEIENVPLQTAPMVTSINTGCGETLMGAQNHAELIVKDERSCEPTGNVAAQVKNFGTNAITAATVVLKENGTEVATQDYVGNIATFATGTVSFTNVVYNPDSTYTAEVTTINAVTPLNGEFTMGDFNVFIAPESANNITIKVYTDNYPGEISWKIKDEAGTVVVSGGPYQVGPGAAGAGGPDANTTKTHYAVLPDGVECYKIEMLDTYGDGWSLGSTPHGIEILQASESVISIPGGNFGSLKAVPAAFKSTGMLPNETFETTKFAVYPNPSNGVFNFVTEETVSVIVTDLTGKTVFTAANIDNGGSIDLSALQSGMYIAKINGASSERIEKLVIK